MIIELLVFLITTILAYYIYVHKKIQHFFAKNGVKYLPGVPVFGNVFRSTFLKRHIIDDIDEVYKAFPDERYVGYIEGTTPILLIRDPDLIKAITVKDFDHFVNHRMFFPEDTEPLFGGSLLMMQGDKWRDMRTTLSPAFTGSKMKQMMPFMVEISNHIVEYLKGTLKDTCNIEKDDVGFATVEEHLKPREHTIKWTDDDLTSQVFIFFVAGFESSAATLVMCIHELAINLEVQNKLYQEIKEYNERRRKLSYEHIGELKYLDCVLNETTRKWSAAIMMDRVCLKTYDLPPPREGGKPVTVKKGDLVYNLVNALQMDPNHYPNPEIFDPERFSDDNKHNIKPFTFMPFGSGPRNCIGSRFALLELKVMIFDLVLNYRIVKTAKTLDPLRLQPADFNLRALGGTSVQFEKRK